MSGVCVTAAACFLRRPAVTPPQLAARRKEVGGVRHSHRRAGGWAVILTAPAVTVYWP